MAAETRAELAAELVVVKAAIVRAQSVQSHADGTGTSVTRGNLSALYKERDRLVKLINAKDNAAGGGHANLVEFQR